MMTTIDWQQSLRRRFREDASRATSYLEAILEDAAEDGYTGAIAAAVEDVIAARGKEEACAIVEGLEVGRSEHRVMMLEVLGVVA